MAEDTKAARRMLTRLSDLLRASLESKGTHEVSLKEELEFLESYLEIEQMRFQDRLTVRIEVDPKALDARVPIHPATLSKPIRHGIAPAPLPSDRDSALRQNGMVNSSPRHGAGCVRIFRKLYESHRLSNTRARLNNSTGAHRFELQEQKAGFDVHHDSFSILVDGNVSGASRTMDKIRTIIVDDGAGAARDCAHSKTKKIRGASPHAATGATRPCFERRPRLVFWTCRCPELDGSAISKHNAERLPFVIFVTGTTSTPARV